MHALVGLENGLGLVRVPECQADAEAERRSIWPLPATIAGTGCAVRRPGYISATAGGAKCAHATFLKCYSG